MFKLLFWGAIIYGIYRYFQMKDQLREGRYREHIQQQQHHTKQEANTEKQQGEGEYIDYEEIK
jgi:hypothetical protein